MNQDASSINPLNYKASSNNPHHGSHRRASIDKKMPDSFIPALISQKYK
eukprot:Pgem_evm1s18418